MISNDYNFWKTSFRLANEAARLKRIRDSAEYKRRFNAATAIQKIVRGRQARTEFGFLKASVAAERLKAQRIFKRARLPKRVTKGGNVYKSTIPGFSGRFAPEDVDRHNVLFPQRKRALPDAVPSLSAMAYRHHLAMLGRRRKNPF